VIGLGHGFHGRRPGFGRHHQRHRLTGEEGPRGDGEQMDLAGQHVVGTRQLDRGRFLVQFLILLQILLGARLQGLVVLRVRHLILIRHAVGLTRNTTHRSSQFQVFAADLQAALR
jgi:hypothetical protein